MLHCVNAERTGAPCTRAHIRLYEGMVRNDLSWPSWVDDSALEHDRFKCDHALAFLMRAIHVFASRKMREPNTIALYAVCVLVAWLDCFASLAMTAGRMQ